jgi:glucosylglycerate hydrolase
VTPEAERDERDGGHAPPTLPADLDLAECCRAVLEEAWQRDGDAGFCLPNATTYPFQWLWDSCFHAVVWAHLGDERAGLELRAALRDQDVDGFVPHVRYVGTPDALASFWGRSGTSSITQPPMYGHAAAVTVAAGLPLDDEVLDGAARGLWFLLRRRRRRPGGLVELCHPWESGCDDSPRWDDVVGAAWTPEAWYETKGTLLGTIERAPGGAPLGNPAFAVGSVGFNALLAWNAAQLAPVVGDAELAAAAAELVEAIDARWDPDLRTWVDDGSTAYGSGRTRTLDALLPTLVIERPEALAQLTDRTAFGAPYGPAGVHRGEAVFDPRAYWRGSAWPQLTYLSWCAARWAGDGDTAASLQNSMASAVVSSRFAEHWDPDSAAALGASPQSWSALACVMAGG